MHNGDEGRREADGTPLSLAASAENSSDDFLSDGVRQELVGLLQYGNLLCSKAKKEPPLDPKELWNACRSRGMSTLQSWGLVVIHNSHFNVFINVVILAASLASGLETDNPQWGFVLTPVNLICLMVFTVEVGIKLVALREFFWVDPNDAAWNRFDFIIVIISILDLIVGAARSNTNTGGIMVVVRVFRLLRVLRSVRTLKTSSGGDLDGRLVGGRARRERGGYVLASSCKWVAFFVPFVCSWKCLQNASRNGAVSKTTPFGRRRL